MGAAMVLGTAAGALQAVAYAVYLRRAMRSECSPNAMSWLMWAYGTAVFFAIEAHLGAPAAILILPGVCACAALAVAITAFRRCGLGRPGLQDRAALAADVALTLAYLGFVAFVAGGARPDEGAGLAFVTLGGLTAVTSSWPTLRSTFARPENERPLPWFVWSAAYGLLALAIMAEGLAWPFLVYPLALQAISLVVGLLALDGAESARAPLGAR
jgi:hypothetical protein